MVVRLTTRIGRSSTRCKKGGARAWEREVAIVLRGMERAAKHEGGQIPHGEGPIYLVARVFKQRQPP